MAFSFARAVCDRASDGSPDDGIRKRLSSDAAKWWATHADVTRLLPEGEVLFVRHCPMLIVSAFPFAAWAVRLVEHQVGEGRLAYSVDTSETFAAEEVFAMDLEGATVVDTRTTWTADAAALATLRHQCVYRVAAGPPMHWVWFLLNFGAISHGDVRLLSSFFNTAASFDGLVDKFAPDGATAEEKCCLVKKLQADSGRGKRRRTVGPPGKCAKAAQHACPEDKDEYQNAETELMREGEPTERQYSRATRIANAQTARSALCEGAISRGECRKVGPSVYVFRQTAEEGARNTCWRACAFAEGRWRTFQRWFGHFREEELAKTEVPNWAESMGREHGKLVVGGVQNRWEGEPGRRARHDGTPFFRGFAFLTYAFCWFLVRFTFSSLATTALGDSL